MTALRETIQSETAGAPEPRRKPAVRPSYPPPSEPDLPGCRPIPLARRDLDIWEGRLEYWDGDTETAWVCEPVGIGHEQPAMRLAGLCALIAAARGAPIECVGSTDLELRDEHGERRKILQADQCVYLYPRHARLPGDGGIFIISAQAPDVPMRQTFLGVLPFFGAELVRVAVLVAFPALTLWLPAVLAG